MRNADNTLNKLVILWLYDGNSGDRLDEWLPAISTNDIRDLETLIVITVCNLVFYYFKIPSSHIFNDS